MGEPEKAAVEVLGLYTAVPQLILSSWRGSKGRGFSCWCPQVTALSIAGNPRGADSARRPGLASSQLCPEGVRTPVPATLCLANYMRSAPVPEVTLCESYLHSSSASTLLLSGLV